jgi:hypothetical protein
MDGDRVAQSEVSRRMLRGGVLSCFFLPSSSAFRRFFSTQLTTTTTATVHPVVAAKRLSTISNVLEWNGMEWIGLDRTIKKKKKKHWNEKSLTGLI